MAPFFLGDAPYTKLLRGGGYSLEESLNLHLRLRFGDQPAALGIHNSHLFNPKGVPASSYTGAFLANLRADVNTSMLFSGSSALPPRS